MKKVIVLIISLGLLVNLLVTSPVFAGEIGTKYIQLNNIYDYVIITNSSLYNVVYPLKNWREITGHTVKIVEVEWITNTYNGSDTPEKIRNFLKDKYSEWETKYVLIVGSHYNIPMRICYTDPLNHDHPWFQVPSDYYYADLTGDWDSDGDGFYGEMYNYSSGEFDDDVDFYPEVYVGRIPEDNYYNVTKICEKIIRFESDNASWKQKSLLLGAKTVGKDDPDDDYMEFLKDKIFEPYGYNITTMYEKEGLDPSPYNCDYPINHSNVLDVWPKGYGIVVWTGHGSPLSSVRTVWVWDDGDNFPQPNETESYPFILNNDAPNLNDEKPSIVFSISCYNAKPEVRNNLGAALIKNGAVAFIGATRPNYMSWSGGEYYGSFSINYHFQRYLINEGQTLAEALYNSKVYNWENETWVSGLNMYGFNLYGDPALPIESYPMPSSPMINGQTNGNAGKEYEYTFFSIDPKGTDLYYWVDWADGTNTSWVGPYASGIEVTINHTWEHQGFYTIRAKAKDINGAESEWGTLSVTMPKNHESIQQSSQSQQMAPQQMITRGFLFNN